MDSAIFPRKEKPLKITLREIRNYVSLALLMAVAIGVLNYWLYHRGFASPLALFLGQKAELAYRGAPPEIDNWLFVTPLIPFVTVLYTTSPFIGLSLLSAFLWAGWLYAIYYLRQKQVISSFLAVSIALFLILGPTSIWFFIQMPQMAFVYTFFIVALYALRRYYHDMISPEYLLFSFAAALVIQNKVPSFQFYWAFVPPLLIIIWQMKRPWMAFLLVFLFPTVFFILVPMILNGLLHSDFSFSGIFNYLPTLQIPLVGYEGDAKETTRYFIEVMVAAFPFIFPFIMMALRLPYQIDKGVQIAFLAAPFIYLWIKLYTGHYVPDFVSIMLFPLFAVMLLSSPFQDKFPRSDRFEWGLGIVFLLALAFDFSRIGVDSPKKDFFQAAAGKPFVHYNLSAEKQMAQKISETSGWILTDDESTYKILYILNNPERLVVPYQYRFQTTLSDPVHFVDWVLVGQNAEGDKVLFAYPSTRFGTLPGFELVFQAGPYSLFKRTSVP